PTTGISSSSVTREPLRAPCLSISTVRVPVNDLSVFGPTRTVASKGHVQVSWWRVSATLGLAWNTNTQVTSMQRVTTMGSFFMGDLLSGPVMMPALAPCKGLVLGYKMDTVTQCIPHIEKEDSKSEKKSCKDRVKKP